MPQRILQAAVVTLFLAWALLSSTVRTLAAQSSHDELLVRIERGDQNAILEAGKTGDKSFIPVLESIAKPHYVDQIDTNTFRNMNPQQVKTLKNSSWHPVYDDPAAVNARMALAKLGVKECLDEIVIELTDPTNAPVAKTWGPSFSSKHVRLWVQMEAAKKLSYIKDRSTVKVFVSLLSGNENPEDYIEGGDVTFRSPSELAMETLPQIVDSPPRIDLPPDAETHDARVKIWQQWWEQNKDKYP
jgi:HEAT repeat protein